MSVNVTPSRAAIAVGETVQLTATVLGDGDPPQDVRWESDDEDVAAVDTSGLVTGTAPGDVTVTATSDFDPAVSGTADITVGAPVDGAGVVILTPNVLLVEVGEAVALEAVVYDAGGDVVADAVIDWSSSDPAIVSVDAAGVVTAEEVVGSVTITASWSGSTDSIYVLVALLAPDTVRVARADVLLIEPAYDVVVLARSAVTDALAVGDVFTSGEVAGRVTSIGVHDDGLIVEFEPVDAFDEIFALFYVKAISEPVVIEGTVSPAGVEITSNIGGAHRTTTFIPTWHCEHDWDDDHEWSDDIEWEFIEGTYDFRWETEFEFELGIDAVWKWFGPIPYPTLDYEGMRTVLTGGPRWDIESPGIRVEAAVEGALNCYAKAVTVRVPVFSLLGIISVNGSLEPRIGFEMDVDGEAEVMVTGPTLTGGHVTFEVGFAHDPDDGFDWIADADATLGEFEPIGDATLDAEVALALGPYLSISGGLGIKLFERDWLTVDIHFAEPKLYLTLDGSLETPIQRSQRGYTGLEWALTYGVKADLKVELVGGVAAALEMLGLETEYGRRGFDVWGPRVWAESPKPTVALQASQSSGAERHGAAPSGVGGSGAPPAITFISQVPERYEGDEVEFWGFENGSDTGRRLTQGPVDDRGIAEATWQPGSEETGEYAVRAHLHSGALGRINLPYPSPSMASVDVGAPPIAVDDEISLYGPVSGPFGPAENSIDVLANDADPAGGALRIVAVTQPAHILQGSARHTDELVYYTFGASTNITARFEYTVENELGLQASATVSVHVGSLLAEDYHHDFGVGGEFAGVSGLVNAAGDSVVTGCSDYWTCRARLRSSDGRFVDLGTLGGANSAAMGLNDQAVVVGWSEDDSFGVRRPFIWDEISGMRDLGTGPVVDREGVAMAVNERGFAVGAVEREWLYTGLDQASVGVRGAPELDPIETAHPGRAVMWRDGVFIDLHDALEARLGVDGRSIATGVTNGDPVPLVVGTFYQDYPREDEPFCFAWLDVNRNNLAEASEIELLPTLGGDACRVHDVNDRGLVVGVASDAAEVMRPVQWSVSVGVGALHQSVEALGMAQLLEAIAGGFDHVPRAVNVHGHVVGDVMLGLSRVPVYWTGGTVVSPTSVAGLPSGWVLERLLDINDRGDVVGVARTPGGELRAILLRVAVSQ